MSAVQHQLLGALPSVAHCKVNQLACYLKKLARNTVRKIKSMINRLQKHGKNKNDLLNGEKKSTDVTSEYPATLEYYSCRFSCLQLSMYHMC